MTTYIALLRGINVGGSNRLTMKSLAATLESLGLCEINTYLQSGNAVFRSPETPEDRLAAQIRTAISARHGLSPAVLVLRQEALERAISLCPFPEADEAPKSVHVFFLAETPEEPDLGSLAKLAKPTERFHLTERFFYLHAPDGIGKSKIGARAERALGVAATARNWRSVRAILELCEAEKEGI